MKNLLASWFNNILAFDETGPMKKVFSIVDPTAAQADGLNTVVLSVDPSDGTAPTIVSLYFDGTGVKLFEKKYQNDADAQSDMSAMAKDLEEAATLSKEQKTDEAKNLATELFDKYKRSSDPLTNEQPTPTMTQSSLNNNLEYKGFQLTKEGDGNWNGILTDRIAVRADSAASVKAKIDKMFHKAAGKTLKKEAGIVMQNVFFDNVEEAMDFQKQTKELQGPEGSAEGKPLWEQNGNGADNQIAPSNESTEPEEDSDLAPSSLSFDRIEKSKAKTDKDIGKRIKDQVKTEVESALEQKSASVFGKDQEELVEALKKNGRNWDEIKKIFVKDLSYNEDDTAVFLDSMRQKEEGGTPEGLPLPPKPPEDLVSPETHDKLVKEVTDKTEIKPEPKPLMEESAQKEKCPACGHMKPIKGECPACKRCDCGEGHKESEIARADNAEIRKVADLDSFNKWMAEKGLTGQDIPGDAWQMAHEEAIKNPEYKKLYDQREQMSKDVYKVNSPEYKSLNDKIVSMWTPYFEQVVYKLMGSKQASLHRKALNPLQEPPAVGQTPGQPLSSPVQENPTFDAPVPESQTSAPEPEFLEAPHDGDRVYVMGDYETGEDGFEGTLGSEFKSKGDDFAVVYMDDGASKEVALHRVVKASQKKVAKAYYEKKADAYQPKTGEPCSCRPGIARDNCPSCEGTGHKIDFKKIREQNKIVPKHKEAGYGNDYSGYTNRSTWALSLWLDNDQKLYDEAREMAKQQPSNEALAAELAATYNGLLEEKGEEAASSQEVNWNEVAQDLIDEEKENAEYEHSQSAPTQIEKLPTLNVEEEKDKIINQLQTETDPARKQELERKYKHLTMASLNSIKEAALKIQAELEHEAEIALYFRKEGIEKQASGDSAFEANGWCRVWIQEDEIASDSRYPAILKFPDENARIAALKELARDLAHEALSLADSSASKVGVQSWFESLNPSDHDRIDWVALASPVNEEEEDRKFEQGMADKYGPDAAIPPQAKSSQNSKIEKKADGDLVALYNLDKMVTSFNETSQDWSGETQDFGFIDKGQLNVNSMEEALAKVKEIYGMDFEPVSDQPGRFETNQTENAEGYADPNGKYLADYSVYIKLYKEQSTGPLREASQKKQAVEPLLGPNGEPLPAKPEIPVTYKEVERAPKHTDRSKAVPATQEQAELAKNLQVSMASIETIKDTVKQVKAELDKRIQELQQAGGMSKLEEDKKKQVDQLAALINATESKIISYGESLYGYSQETKTVGPKLTDAWRVEKLVAKFAGAAEYLKAAEAGAQSLAEEVTTKTLTKFPKLSRLDKKADFMDSLGDVYSNVMAALKLIVGNEPTEPQAI